MPQRSDFTWLERLGEGSFGVVHRVIHKKTGDIYAIKASKHSLSSNDYQTFHQELSFISKLRHRNIIDHVCSFEQDNKLFIVTEYLPFNLLTHIEISLASNEKGGVSGVALTEAQCRPLMHQLCLALNHIHSKGIIHRDIKPENLLIDATHGRLVLCDFGFARFIPHSHNDGELTGYIATRWYRAPELLMQNGHYTSAVDVWAMGCVLGEMIDGCPVFDANTDVDSLYQIALTLDSDQTTQEIESLGLTIANITTDMRKSLNTKSLQARYGNLVSEECLDFLAKLLRINDAERMTIVDALKHPWLNPPSPSPPAVAVTVTDSVEESKEQYVDAAINERSSGINSVVYSPTVAKKKIQWREEKTNTDDSPDVSNESVLSHITLQFELLQSLPSTTAATSYTRQQQILRTRHHPNRHAVQSEESSKHYGRTKPLRPIQLTPVSSPPHSRSQSISMPAQPQPPIHGKNSLLEPITGHALLWPQTPRDASIASSDDSGVEGVIVNEREIQRRGGKPTKPALLPAFHPSFDPQRPSLPLAGNEEPRPVSKGVKKRSELTEVMSLASISLAGHSFASYRPVQPHVNAHTLAQPASNARGRRHTQKIVPISSY